jgi:putative DNA primase/helicase
MTTHYITRCLDDAGRAACEQIGVIYRSVPADGRFHAANLADDPRGRGDGRIMIYPDGRAGVVKNWKSGEMRPFFADRPAGARVSAAERRRIKAEQARRRSEQQRQHDRTARRAQAIWRPAPLSPITQPYLARKRIGPHGARMTTWRRSYRDAGGQRHELAIPDTLILPMFNEAGSIRNLQAIFPAESLELGRGKDFLPFGETAGLFWWIGPEKTDPVLIAEGFATAATLHEETGYRVYIAFTAGNLLAVGLIVRKHLPAVKIIFAADNDKTPGNPGLTKANEAALAVDGFVACPPITGDFNDYTLALQDANP